VTKILAWGGDYWMALEKVYGHLVMARGERGGGAGREDRPGLVTEPRRCDGERMFRTNAEALYGLR